MIAILFCFLFLFSFGSCSVIIPEELPSVLSVAYSNIPPIKKGTDSRVGFGFAFGNHADFQIMLELGPQTNTLPLTGQSFASNNKRQAPPSPPPKINKNREKFLQTDAGKYLQSWAQNMKSPYKPVYKKPEISKPGEVMNLEDSMVELVKNDKGEYEIHQPQPENVPEYVLNNLKRLYGEKKQEAQQLGEQKRSEEEVRKVTEDLSNVDMD